MKLRWAMVAICGLFVSAALAEEKEKASSDKDALQGTWKAESGIENGKKATEDQLKDFRLIIKGDKITVKLPGDQTLEGTYKLNPSAKPKQIDADFSENMKGKGIYKLEGDKLTLAHGALGAARPDDFTSKEGSDVTMMVLKRQKDKK